MAMASSRDLHDITATTGPKISSRATRIFGSTSTNTVGSWKKPFASAPLSRRAPPVPSRAPSARPLAAGRAPRPFVASDLHVLHHRLQLRVAVRRPHLGLGLQPVADDERLRPRHELVDELLVDLLVHNDAAGRSAALPGGAEAAPQAAVHRQLEGGVVHDHDDVLAAPLESDLLVGRR